MAIARDISLQKKLEEERARLAANLLEVQEKECAISVPYFTTTSANS